MDKKTLAIIAAGILVSALVYFVSPYLAGIAVIILIAIIMSLLIMQDTTFLPQVEVRLREDAKGIILKNSGNAPAEEIHVALVPLNIEYDVPSLAVDALHEYPLASMIVEVKAVITFKNEHGISYSLTKNLSASREEYDPLKPMIPIFGWK